MRLSSAVLPNVNGKRCCLGTCRMAPCERRGGGRAAFGGWGWRPSFRRRNILKHREACGGTFSRIFAVVGSHDRPSHPSAPGGTGRRSQPLGQSFTSETLAAPLAPGEDAAPVVRRVQKGSWRGPQAHLRCSCASRPRRMPCGPVVNWWKSLTDSAGGKRATTTVAPADDAGAAEVVQTQSDWHHCQGTGAKRRPLGWA